MKVRLFFLLLVAASFAACFPSFAQKKELPTVNVSKIPSSVEEFIALRDKIGKTPEGGATVFIVALKLYAENPELGLPCLTIAINRQRLSKGKGGYKGYVPAQTDLSLIKRIKEKPYLANSYFQNTSPKNGYALPKALQIKAVSNPYSGNKDAGDFKIYIACSGADSDRPIRLKRNNRGIWKAHEFSSLLLGIRPPEVQEDDDF